MAARRGGSPVLPDSAQVHEEVTSPLSALHRFEQRLEHMVTGVFARAFRSAVQPMEIAAALQREVDNSAQILSRDRRLAPNVFAIDLSVTDYDRLSSYGETLSGELAAMLHEHANEQRYLFAGPLKMSFHRVDDLTTGRFRVRSEASAQVTSAAGQSVTDTAAKRAGAVLEIAGTKHPLHAPGLVVGRGSDADIRIDDPGVSRRHVEFRVRPDADNIAISVVDLGSTNGITVDGHRVQHALLTDGNVVTIGSTRIVVELTGAPRRSGGRDATESPVAPPMPTTGRSLPSHPLAEPRRPGAAQGHEQPPYQPRPYPGPASEPPRGPWAHHKPQQHWSG